MKGLVKVLHSPCARNSLVLAPLSLCCPLNELIPSVYSPPRWTAPRVSISLYGALKAPGAFRYGTLQNISIRAKGRHLGVGCCGPGPMLAHHQGWAPREWVPTGSHALDSMVPTMGARFLGTLELTVHTTKLNAQIHTSDGKKPCITVNTNRCHVVRTAAVRWVGLCAFASQRWQRIHVPAKLPTAHRGPLPLPAHPPSSHSVLALHSPCWEQGGEAAVGGVRSRTRSLPCAGIRPCFRCCQAQPGARTTRGRGSPLGFGNLEGSAPGRPKALERVPKWRGVSHGGGAGGLEASADRSDLGLV